MKKQIFLSLSVIFLISYCSAQQVEGSLQSRLSADAPPKLGEVACVYITTSNLDSSLAVYEKLGFPKIASNTMPVPWAQVSDGSLLIMMRNDKIPYMGLTYYALDVEKKVEQFEKNGIVFTKMPNEDDKIKRYYFKSPDGFDIMLASNVGAFKQPGGLTMLNMNPEDFNEENKFPNKQCGVFGEYCHPVKNLETSIAFWEKLGFELKMQQDQPYPHAILSDGLMIIGLHQTDHFNYPAITYFGINTESRIKDIQKSGLRNFKEFMGKKNQVLGTYEGQHFFIFSMGM